MNKQQEIDRQEKRHELTANLNELLNPRTRVQSQVDHIQYVKGFLKRARSTKSITKLKNAVLDNIMRLDDIKQAVKLGTIDNHSKFLIGVMEHELYTLGYKLENQDHNK